MKSEKSSKLNGRRVTIQHVAREAGVSPSTVSRVLTGNGSVAEDLRAIVLETVQRLSYRPNQIARSLKVQKTGTLGLLINDVLNPFYSAVAKGVEDVARAAGYSVIFCNTSEDYELECNALSMLNDKAVDGIILAPVGNENLGTLESLLAMGVRLVQIDRQIPQLKASAVLLDNFGGAYQATRHLLERDHTRIGLINHVAGRMTLMQRELGYLQALADAGIQASRSAVCHISFDMSNLTQQLTHLLTRQSPCTALFATNNRLGIEMLRALKHMQMQIPDDVAVVVFDDLELFELNTPSITAVAQPAYAMGYRSAELLLEQLGSDLAVPTQIVTFHTDLIERESSGSFR
jgi:LacI family transcriptional regulator